MAERKRLPVREQGRRYEGWVRCSDDGEPICVGLVGPCVEVYPSKRAAMDWANPGGARVRRVTIVIEEE